MSEKYLCTLITGAGQGIGRAIAIECAKSKMNLLLVARSKTNLKELKAEIEGEYSVKVDYVTFDLSRDESPAELYKWCIQNGYSVNMLVNNVGCGLFGEFEQIALEKQRQLMKLNMECLVELIHLFLPMLKEQPRGYILNVASIAALYPLPYYSVYGASKAFVLSFTEALRFELRDFPICVSCLCPGDTDTNFFVSAGNTKKKKTGLMEPSIVAQAAVKGLLKDQAVIYPGHVKWLSKIPKAVLRNRVYQRVIRYL